MFLFNLLFCYLFIVAFSFSSMERCLQNPNCREELDKTYEKMLIKVVIAWYPDLLKKINTVPNLVISDVTTSSLFSAIAVDHLKKTITPECKSTIHPFTRFPFFYVYQGDTEAEGRYLNMNCFFVDYEQYENLKKCISSEHFNIYSKKSKEILVKFTEKKCNNFLSFKFKCKNVVQSRIDIVQGNIICYKQTNKVYNAFVDTAKKDLMFHNGGKTVNKLFQELPAEGSDFLNTCIPNCESCFSYEKCKQCKPQYHLFNNQCIKCENNSQGCLVCKENLVLYKDQCLEQCPHGFFDQNKVCMKCDQECKECNKTCIRCFNQFVFQEDKCQIKCNDGFYLNVDTLICQPCSLDCLECISDQVCITCASGFIKTNGECVGGLDMNFIVIILFIIIVLIIVIILSLIFFSMCYKNKRQQNQNKINIVQLQERITATTISDYSAYNTHNTHIHDYLMPNQVNQNPEVRFLQLGYQQHN